MLTKEKVANIERMIRKELSRNSLVELCEYWEVSVDEFEEFLECAFNYIDLQE